MGTFLYVDCMSEAGKHTLAWFYMLAMVCHVCCLPGSCGAVSKCMRTQARDLSGGVTDAGWGRQANLVKQLAKLVKVRYVEDITHSERVGAAQHICCSLEMRRGMLLQT